MSERAEWIGASMPPLVPGTKAHAMVATPLIFTVAHTRWWTLGMLFGIVLILGILSWRGRNIGWLYRRLKARMRGNVVSARPLFYRRRVQRLRGYGEIDINEFRA